MGIINTETFINEDGVEMKKDTYENGMTHTYEANPSEPIEPVEPSEPEPTQLDRIEENVNKLVTETTVTDVLLGVE